MDGVWPIAFESRISDFDAEKQQRHQTSSTDSDNNVTIARPAGRRMKLDIRTDET